MDAPNKEKMKKILDSQRNEITEHIIYQKLSRSVKSPSNRKILERISRDELSHYNIFRKYTGKELGPRRLSVWKYFLISKLFGLTFGLKLMENGEKDAQEAYQEISKSIPEAKKIIRDENEHEKELLDMLDEEKLKYAGSIVLGLNDALVELTGALAGFTFALQNSSLIAVVGLITGVAASLSMGASEYLSTKTEGGKKPGKSSLYTGIAYIITVALLIAPFLLLSNVYLSLLSSIIIAVLVILGFTFYISVAKDLPFRRRFGEMAGISLGVAGITFLIGILIRLALGIEV